MTFETGVGTAGALLDANSGRASVAIEFAVNDVEARLVFVQAHLEIQRLALVQHWRPIGCQVRGTPFDVKNAARRATADGCQDTTAGSVGAKVIREGQNRVVEES